MTEEELKKQKEIDVDIERLFNSIDDPNECWDAITAKYPDIDTDFLLETLTVLSGGDIIGEDE